MTLNELRFVVALAKIKNFKKAADASFITQPALSLAVKKLEDELGVMLFERSRKEISLTTIGELVVQQATKVLEEAERVKEIAKHGQNQLSGQLKLGAIYSVGPYLIPELIPLLRQAAPEMPLLIEENLTANLENQLKGGVIDLAIIALPFNIPGINTIPLYEEEFAVVVPSGHEWAKRKSIAADELNQEKVLLLSSGHCFSNQVIKSCPSLTRKGEVLQGNSLETIRNMVASNLGITVLPISATGSKYQNGLTKVIPFDQPRPKRQIALAWRKSFFREQAVKIVADSIRKIEMFKDHLI